MQRQLDTDARAHYVDRAIQQAVTIWQALEHLSSIPATTRYQFTHFLDRLYNLTILEIRTQREPMTILEEDRVIRRRVAQLVKLWYRLLILQASECKNLNLDRYTISVTNGRINLQTLMFLAQCAILLLLTELQEQYEHVFSDTDLVSEHMCLQCRAISRRSDTVQWLRAHEMWAVSSSRQAYPETVFQLSTTDLSMLLAQCSKQLLECEFYQHCVQQEKDETNNNNNNKAPPHKRQYSAHFTRLSSAVYAIHYACADRLSFAITATQPHTAPDLRTIHMDTTRVLPTATWLDDCAQQITALHQHLTCLQMCQYPYLYFSQNPLALQYTFVEAWNDVQDLSLCYPVASQAWQTLADYECRLKQGFQCYTEDNIDDNFKEQFRQQIAGLFLRGGERNIYTRDHIGVTIRNERRILEYFRGEQQIENILAGISPCPGLEFDDEVMPLITQMQYLHILKLLVQSQSGLNILDRCVLRAPDTVLSDRDIWHAFTRGLRPFFLLCAGHWFVLFEGRMILAGSVMRAIVIWCFCVIHLCPEGSVDGIPLGRYLERMLYDMSQLNNTSMCSRTREQDSQSVSSLSQGLRLPSEDPASLSDDSDQPVATPDEQVIYVGL